MKKVIIILVIVIVILLLIFTPLGFLLSTIPCMLSPSCGFDAKDTESVTQQANLLKILNYVINYLKKFGFQLPSQGEIVMQSMQ